MTVGDRIRDARLAKGMTQEELAKRCGYTNRSTISKIEKNVCETRLSTVEKIAKVLDVDPDYLVFGDYEEKREEINRLFDRLDEYEQDAVLSFLTTLLGERAEG